MDDGLIEEHLDYLRRCGMRQKTIDHRRDNVRRLARQLELLRVTGGLLAATSRDLTRWQSGLTVSTSSVQTYTGHTRAFYRWLRSAHHRDDDPAADLPMPRLPRRKPHPIPEKDLALAFRCADARMQVWLGLAGWCGLRAGEIAGLNDTSLVEVDVDEDGDPTNTLLLRVDGKGGKERIVPIPEAMHLMIRSVACRGRWFRTATGLLATGNYVSTTASQFFTGIGMPYTLHWCRHRFGTQHYRLCKDIRATQELLGHSNPSTTALYVELAQRTAVTTVNHLGKTLPVPGADLRTVVPDEPSDYRRKRSA
ncbi:tyrosine-type recombinase/integrase [Amycolatopsis tolypomycina]|nr:tyrosine-type recombinase/integrase [Amycolatopsis tolypomycina]